MEATAGRVVFTVVVLAIFVGAIVYTAMCARVIVEREGADAELEEELARVVDAAAARLDAERLAAARQGAARQGTGHLDAGQRLVRPAFDMPVASTAAVSTPG